MKIFIVAGEASGDLHAAGLAAELLARDPSLTITGLGGQRMRDAGVDIVEDITAHAAVGIVEVVGVLSYFWKLFGRTRDLLKRERPDVVVLTDFPEFNLRLAGVAKKLGLRVVYFISPQLWAWRSGRVQIVKRDVDRMLCLFGFEEAWYRERGVEAVHIGHPILDQLAPSADRATPRAELGVPPDGPLFGLFPGSRRKEFRYNFPILAEVASILAREVPGARFVTGCAPRITPEMIAPFARSTGLDLHPVEGRTLEAMRASDYALVASGTATLECAVLGTPLSVVYDMSLGTQWLARIFTGGREHYSLPNIVAGRTIVPEFYGVRAKPRAIADAARAALEPAARERTRQDFAEMRERLGRPGALRNAAAQVLDVLGRQG
ncbi:MAG: lipid-A-disaccharide synthase [Candidatus Brocadiae bacterium]|nr:lipid-A-disaccharide synthase [Candidatus Brocadiia bacterium]